MSESIVIKYGIVKKYKNYTLWFEPITDILDGFVLRPNDDPDAFVEVYPRRIYESE